MSQAICASIRPSDDAELDAILASIKGNACAQWAISRAMATYPFSSADYASATTYIADELHHLVNALCDCFGFDREPGAATSCDAVAEDAVAAAPSITLEEKAVLEAEIIRAGADCDAAEAIADEDERARKVEETRAQFINAAKRHVNALNRGLQAGTKGPAAADEGSSDRDLIRLGKELQEASAKEKASWKSAEGKNVDLKSDDPLAQRINAAVKACATIVDKIEHATATTLEGLKVKVAAISYCDSGDPFEGETESRSHGDKGSGGGGQVIQTSLSTAGPVARSALSFSLASPFRVLGFANFFERVVEPIPECVRKNAVLYEGLELDPLGLFLLELFVVFQLFLARILRRGQNLKANLRARPADLRRLLLEVEILPLGRVLVVRAGAPRDLLA